MQKRAVRVSILGLLFAAAAVAGYLSWDLQRRAERVFEAERYIDERLDRLDAAAAALGAAQQAYVAPGQFHTPWFQRASSLLQQLHDELGSIRPALRSPGAPAAVRMMDDNLSSVASTDARVREHLRLEQELMASDLVFAEGRPTVDSILEHVASLRAGERAVADADGRALARQQLIVFALVSIVWLGGVLALARVPSSAAPLTSDLELAADVPDRTEMPEPEPAPEAGPTAAPPSPAVDLAEAARICTALSRATDANALPELLARMAQLLDAAGLVIWLGAGEELFAVCAQGYDPRVMARVGPIARTSDNATAAAWRTGEIRTVPGGPSANGAIVAPLFGPAGCIGVLAAEVRHGREADPSAQAVAAMFASQLAAVVAAWPGPSVAGGRDEDAPPRAAANA